VQLQYVGTPFLSMRIKRRLNAAIQLMGLAAFIVVQLTILDLFIDLLDVRREYTAGSIVRSFATYRG
jgi:hypothetical protein